jgi:hypothetical protein
MTRIDVCYMMRLQRNPDINIMNPLRTTNYRLRTAEIDDR